MKLVGEDGSEYPLDKLEVTIGRAPHNDIRLPGLKVSRNHAVVRTNDNRAILKDLNSTNGTFVNGKQIFDFTLLEDGDLIAFGVDSFVFRMGEAVPGQPLRAGSEDVTAQVEPLFGATMTEADNVGVRLDTLEQASAFWLSQLASGSPRPFVQYRFSHPDDARNAMLALPFIHLAMDSHSIIATRPVTFGIYQIAQNMYEAVIYGGDLAFGQWQHTRDILSRHGGIELNYRSPAHEEPVPYPMQRTAPLGDVVFVREERRTVRPGVEAIYRIYRGVDEAAAIAFLERSPVTQPYYAILVQTPAGNFVKNMHGWYRE
jgi:pSer/pThr/pTyr-binding forkhead associated (FHA) protein